MAARGFIELLRLADYGRQRQQGGQENENVRWSGIAFSFAGYQFVAPLGEVAEVVPVPASTTVPSAKPWMRGLANVRGRLLPLTDLAIFLQLPETELSRLSKVMIIDQAAHYSGVIVDQVMGIQHFNKQSYFGSNPQLPEVLAQYTHGYFERQGQQWHVFLLSKLVQDQTYLNASA
ncbi:chemotaxis protein CheW [Alkanindiges sp. WGS2144]|uniref:chemotaxis protein CheW n=1 Tax=Alkanindiges sp. WGS2144 TaxID=3366808 RepID=UPI003753CB6A